jgi:hypothetical protein
MKHLILALGLFTTGCAGQQQIEVNRTVVQVNNNAAEMEALKIDYKENWQKEKESEEGWVKARKRLNELALKIVEAKTAEESFEFAKELAEISPVEKKLWQDWKDCISRRYAIVERMEQLSK